MTAFAWTLPLPTAWACRILAAHAKTLKAPLLFFGDLDPQALHLFAALRAGGRDALRKGADSGLPIEWVGLDDRWLDFACRQMGVPDVPRGWQIPLTWLDAEYWQLVKRMVPDVRRVIGKRACGMLDAGVKLEVDAFLTAVRGPFLNELMGRIGARARRKGRSAPALRKREQRPRWA